MAALAIDRFMAFVHPEPNSGCWLWLGAVNDKGYGYFALKPHTNRAHRAAWQLFKGGLTSGIMVLHKCDNRTCVNPNHLFLGTAKDNAGDAITKGRHTKGEKHGQSKLTERDIPEIRRLSSIGWSAPEIAAAFGVSDSSVGNVINFKNWRHIP